VKSHDVSDVGSGVILAQLTLDVALAQSAIGSDFDSLQSEGLF
jgi:hypothetical protein